MNDQSRIRNDLALTIVYERITVNNCSAQITMAYWQNFSFHDYLICRQMDEHHWPQRPKKWLSTWKENLHSSMRVAWLLLERGKREKKKEQKKHMQLFQIPTFQLSPLAFIAAGISNPTFTIWKAPAVNGWETYFQNPRKNVLHCGLCPWLAP